MRFATSSVRGRSRTVAPRRSGAGRYLSILGLVLLAAAWIVLAPTQLGGQVSYIFVIGISMEPLFNPGDLAIVREADSYEVGDVVTYRHPDIGPVIHRIQGLDGSRFVMKGDNNNYLDGYQPTSADVLGKLWFWIPGAGTLLQNVRTPWIYATLAGILGMVAVLLATGTGWQRAQWPTRPGLPSARRLIAVPPRPHQMLFAASCVLGTAALVLVIVTVQQPLVR